MDRMTQRKFLRVLAGEPVWPPPIWLMRQAGRYLPEFRALRAQADFLTRCLTPDLATEITLQPLRRFDMDAAILFSDILMVPWGLGQSLRFAEGDGPILEPIRDEAGIDRLDAGRLADATAPIMETVRRVRTALEADWSGTALLGFAGSPFTVACYMVEGRGSRDFTQVRRMAYEAPASFDRLLAILVEATVSYLLQQIDAGAEAVMLFDSWSGILSEPMFSRLVIAPTDAIVRAVRAARPGIRVIGFPRLAGSLLGRYSAETKVDAIGLDTSFDLAVARSSVDARTALQGNLDPVCLLTGGPLLDAEATRIALSLEGHPHIFNLGHGVVPETPPEHVAQLVARVRSL